MAKAISNYATNDGGSELSCCFVGVCLENKGTNVKVSEFIINISL